MSDHTDMRSPLGRATGLGSAKEGVQHWWAQRLTAVALVPLLLWFVAALTAHLGASRADTWRWLGSPGNAIAMILLLIAAFYHMMLGVQVVIEDYIANEWARLAAIVLNKFVALALAVSAIFAVVRIAVGG